MYDSLYVEKIVYLPQSFPFKPANPSPHVNKLPALENGYITFGMFNNSRKFSLDSIKLWGKVMQLIPNSKIMFAGVSNHIFKGKLYQRLEEQGIEASRISVEPQLPLFEFLELFHKVDICLDTFPYSGGTTTAHSLWMGVPVLTLSGETLESNQSGAHLLTNGLQEWICCSHEEYLLKAKYWSDHIQELNNLRKSLRQTFETTDGSSWDIFSKGLELALTQMWLKYCMNLPTESFRIKS
jgi:predicted O-linked N-acetylglucosamine transferase (SPINDLY family)